MYLSTFRFCLLHSIFNALIKGRPGIAKCFIIVIYTESCQEKYPINLFVKCSLQLFPPGSNFIYHIHKIYFINHFMYRTKSRVNSIYPQNVTPQGPIKAFLNVPAGCYPTMPLSDLHKCTYNNPFYPQATGCYFSGSL